MRIITCVLLLTSLLVQALSFADNSLRIVRDPKQLPEDKFIYFVYDLHTDEMHYGYSPKQPSPTDLTAQTGQGLRTGGHFKLAQRILGGISVDEYKELYPQGEGRFVGGGIVIHQGEVILHRFNSVKAAGSAGRQSGDNADQNYMNPRLPIVNPFGAGLIAEAYSTQVFSKIINDTELPFMLDPEIVNSQFYRFNKEKHGTGDSFLDDYLKGSYYLPRVAAELNSQLLGSDVPSDYVTTLFFEPIVTLEHNRQYIIKYLKSKDGRSTLEDHLKTDRFNVKSIAEFKGFAFRLLLSDRINPLDTDFWLTFVDYMRGTSSGELSHFLGLGDEGFHVLRDDFGSWYQNKPLEVKRQIFRSFAHPFPDYLERVKLDWNPNRYLQQMIVEMFTSATRSSIDLFLEEILESRETIPKFFFDILVREQNDQDFGYEMQPRRLLQFFQTASAMAVLNKIYAQDRGDSAFSKNKERLSEIILTKLDIVPQMSIEDADFLNQFRAKTAKPQKTVSCEIYFGN